ncbi:SusC/RagA family TonB-linked outer membrane protein [Epilithonimonas arachidiradicis]|uniref:SusC/RagA family TonB-linked outer membrane protein n=1 Tax=Epilithonimonas arachidiradicis TaxID=1617282 RepID=A0A420DBG2_9FLAO|nr:SusC/RagA family TonB-linked outer membrane protein [Epilithonimonas arachidiradicis]RKE88850.1 TonB-linked SusC/RagA family outer membrane protein [Epilithonimonas arachidiradicis]GGG54584.1 SusC/RagA family TonB-linked outer membrane protein [Epilithonimonas arachidiradicis]
MNVKLKIFSGIGALFFTGQALAQNVKNDTVPTEKSIAEVVVLGYSRTTTKAKSNEAVTTVGAETLENRPNVSFLNSLQGAAPGITVNSMSGSPGSGKFNILIRGLSSLNASTDPLYVIDGLISSGTQFRNLNAEDIASVSVLKDAQATAVYGNRGANGVVVINTKNARYNSGLKINYNALSSFSTFPKPSYNTANAKEFLQIQKNYGAGEGNLLTQAQIDNWAGADTDWGKEFFQTGMSQSHNLGFRFGGENVAVYSSLGYQDVEGIMKSTDFKRFTFRNNITGKSSNGRFTYNSQLAASYSRRHQFDEETNTAINANVVQNPLFGSLMGRPTISPYRYANGRGLFAAIGTNTAGNNALVLSDIINGGIRNRFTEMGVLANLNLNYKLTDYLSIGNKVGVDYKNSDRVLARDPNGFLSLAVAVPSGIPYGGSETMNNTSDLTFSNVTNITFNKSFGLHTLTAAAYMDYLKVHWQFKQQTQNGLDPINWKFGAGTGYVPFNTATPTLYLPAVSGRQINGGTLAYFGTLDYDYDGKYGIAGVVRRDGSYRFLPANRWETFWSASARWNIDKESFMENTNFRMLKLRFSAGTTGNQNLGVPADNTNPLTLNASNYLDYYGTTLTASSFMGLPGYLMSNLSNTQLRWEKVTQYNAGLDFAYKFVEGNIDVYRKVTSRMFNDLVVSAPAGPPSTINTTTKFIRGNNGEMENKGIEALLRFNVINNDNVKFSVFVNGAYNKNEIISLDREDTTGDFVNVVGGPAYQWHLYPYIGVNSANGNQQFLDINGAITETPVAEDRRLTGKSYLPKFTGGFGFNAEYNGFFLDTLFSFQQGGWIYDNFYQWQMTPAYAGANYNVSADLLNAWTPTNTSANVPSLSASNIGREGQSDRFLYRSDFIRLKNISLGYSFTRNQLGNLPISGFKIFAQAENLITWSDWKGYDPEPMNRYSLNIFPNAKTVSVGFNVEF